MAEQATARKKIFISHSSQDKHIAEELCKALEMKGFGCWICTRDIEGGQSFAKAIVKAIKQSCLLILVFSKNANSSEFVEREVNHAVSNKIRLFPLKTENVEPSESLAFLIGLNQWLDIYDPPLEKHFPAIISAVSKLVKEDEQPKDPPPVTQIPDAKPRPGDFLLKPSFRKTSKNGEKRPRVFICHTSEDTDFADALYGQLNAAGLDPWLDKENLRGGDRWDDMIQKVIKNEIDYFLVLQSESLQKKARGKCYVNKEINKAREQQKMFPPSIRFIIPLKIGDCETLEELKDIQTIPIDDRDNIAELVRLIDRDFKKRGN